MRAIPTFKIIGTISLGLLTVILPMLDKADAGHVIVYPIDYRSCVVGPAEQCVGITGVRDCYQSTSESNLFTLGGGCEYVREYSYSRDEKTPLFDLLRGVIWGCWTLVCAEEIMESTGGGGWI